MSPAARKAKCDSTISSINSATLPQCSSDKIWPNDRIANNGFYILCIVIGVLDLFHEYQDDSKVYERRFFVVYTGGRTTSPERDALMTSRPITS